ncbi:hypothetical protein BH10PLA1_BH10PLA1_19420 [soil metagenome]
MKPSSTDQLPLLGRSRRDDRLDFWRGLCLIDMVLVHLVQKGMQFSPLGHAFFTEYTRFAAGGYVMLAGMTIGFVYLPRVLDSTRRLSAYRALIRRAAYIFWIHVAVTTGQLVLIPLRGETLPPLIKTFWDILMFREGYDLLPFYIIMLALTPLVLEVVCRRRDWILPILSFGLFAWGHHNDEYKAHSFQITGTFFFMLWQLPFLIGLLAGAKLRKYDALPMAAKVASAVIFWGLSVLFFFGAYAAHFGIAFEIPYLTFWKNPLTFGEVLRYTALVGAIITTTNLAWRWIGGTAMSGFVGRLGRRSLAMYITQIFLVGWVDKLNDLAAARWGVWGLQFVFMTLAIVLLWCFAWLLDWRSGVNASKLRAASASVDVPTSQTRPISVPS